MAEFSGLPPPSAYSVPPGLAIFNHGQWPSPMVAPFSEFKAQALRTVCTGNESYRSGRKGMKYVVLGQKAEFSPTAEKKGLVPMRYQLRCSNCAGNRVVSTHRGVVVGCQTPFLAGDQSSHRPSVEPIRFSM